MGVLVSLGKRVAVDHVRIANLMGGYRLRVHSPSLKKARSPSRIVCPCASVQTPCQGQHFLLCRPALSSAFFVCAAPPSCLGQDSQASMILRQNHRSRTLSCLVCDCQIDVKFCRVKNILVQSALCRKVCHLEVFKYIFW